MSLQLEATAEAGPSEVHASKALLGLSALCLIARLHRVAADPGTLLHQLGLADSDTFKVADLLLASKHLGLKAKLSKSSSDRLQLNPLPALAVMRTDDGSLRVVILAQCDGQRVLFQDVDQDGRPTIESLEVFAQQWTGELILITSRASLAGELAKFDFSWFIPSMVKYRKLLGEVLLISFFLQLFGLVSPLFFQVVMDKVLVHRGLTTLDVLVIGLVVVVIFESILNALRAYVFSHICQGRTVLIIAHRLSAVRRANRIIVMDKGRIVEAGPHDALVQQAKGLYANLWRMQDGGQSAQGATA